MAALAALAVGPAAGAQVVRFAAYDSGLGRKGPGLMLRDLRRGEDPQAEAALQVIAAAGADVLLLADVDWDHGGAGLAALRERLREAGIDYPHALALQPNSGLVSGLDLDGDGQLGGPRDSLGYGWFTGDSGIALLSRLPLGEPRDLSGILWSERAEIGGLVPEAGHGTVPLATTAQWVVPLEGRDATIVTLAAGTPLYDGPEDRNGLRNAAELTLVAELAGAVSNPVVLGRANLDPVRGAGRREALGLLLDHPALQDPRPEAPGSGTATAFWETAEPMRMDYVLPARGLRVAAAGVTGAASEDSVHAAAVIAGPGRLVWVDVELPEE